MLKFNDFKKQLFEGGNLIYHDPKTGKEHRSSPIHIDDRQKLRPHIKNIVSGIRHAIGMHHVADKDFHKTMVGSSEHFHNDKVSDDHFRKVGKHHFGDQDALVSDTPEHKKRLKDHLKPGTKHHGWSLIHSKEDVGGAGHFTLWHHPKHGTIQIDLNHAKHDKHGMPTKAERFAKSSPHEDLFPKEKGAKSLKGAAHKFAMHGLTSALGKPVSIQMKTKRKPGLAKLSYAVSASGGGGLRQKTKALLDKHGKVQHDPETGHEIHIETESKGAHRIENPKDVAHAIIKHAGKTPHEHDEHDIHSMRGIHRILHRHFDHETHGRYVHHMAEKLYGKGSQVISRHDVKGGREADHKVKDDMLHEIKRSFPKHFTPDFESKLKDMKTQYDKKHAK